MLTFLVAIDGSGYSDSAVGYAVRRAGLSKEPVRVHLLNVQLSLTGVNVKLFIKAKSVESYYRDEGMAVLEAPRGVLSAAGISCDHHIGVGDPGQVIVDFAQANSCDEIVMGTHGRGALAGAVMGSVARNVIQRSSLPVVLVKGQRAAGPAA
ncbi:MAG: universal stress protein [Gammaproteobacteria bacterium]|jgi:nucleotide-binding universal stress UspA family protein